MPISVPLSVCVFVLLSLSACAPHAGPQARRPAPEVLPSASPTTRPEASAPDVSDKLPQGAAGPTAQPAVPSPSASPAGTGGSDTDSPLLPASPLHDPVIRGGGSGSTGGGTGTPQPSPTPLFYIADVTLADTGQSVMGANAPAALAPVYTADAPIDLLITGNFATTIPFSEAAMRFTFEPGLLHQSFNGDAPAVRVLLNESLLLEPIDIQPQALWVRLHSRAVPDLQQDSLLDLKVISGQQAHSMQIRTQRSVLHLPPIISTAEVIKEANMPTWLKLRGQNFMLRPAANAVSISLSGSGEYIPLPAALVQIDQQGIAELWLDAQPISTWDAEAQYEILFQTPLGLNTHILEGWQ